jgi:hypothetical protein
MLPESTDRFMMEVRMETFEPMMIIVRVRMTERRMIIMRVRITEGRMIIVRIRMIEGRMIIVRVRIIERVIIEARSKSLAQLPHLSEEMLPEAERTSTFQSQDVSPQLCLELLLLLFRQWLGIFIPIGSIFLVAITITITLFIFDFLGRLPPSPWVASPSESSAAAAIAAIPLGFVGDACISWLW